MHSIFVLIVWELGCSWKGQWCFCAIHGVIDAVQLPGGVGKLVRRGPSRSGRVPHPDVAPNPVFHIGPSGARLNGPEPGSKHSEGRASVIHQRLQSSSTATSNLPSVAEPSPAVVALAASRNHLHNDCKCQKQGKPRRR